MWAVFGKPDPTMGCNGLLAGLVAITAPCAFVNPVGSVIIGAIAGVLVIWGVLFVERMLKIDDPVGAVAVHGCNGAWGCLSLGLFATGEYGGGWNGVAGHRSASSMAVASASSRPRRSASAANFVWVFGCSIVFFKILDATMGMRVSAKAEIEGLDIHEMGVSGYISEDSYAVQIAGQEHLSVFGPGVPAKTKPSQVEEIVGRR